MRKFIVYFQPYSNTYAPLETLKRYYEEALSHPEVIGLTIGTRPDCVDEAKIAYLESLAKDYDITIEYGLESISDETLKKINRGHDVQCYLDALEMTRLAFGQAVRFPESSSTSCCCGNSAGMDVP